jgi:hypothetical protein
MLRTNMKNVSDTAVVTAKVEQLEDDEGQMLIMPPGFQLESFEYLVAWVGASLLLTPKGSGRWDEFFKRPSQVPADFLRE